MRVSFAALGAVVMAVAIGACGSSPTGSSTPGGTLAPGATATSVGTNTGPTPAPTAPTGATNPPVAGTGHECDAVPTPSVSNPNPASPPPDAALLAHFPATIDGQSLTDVQAMQWLYILCVFPGGQAIVDNVISQAGGGFNFTTMSFGSATATVDGDEVRLTAFRTPGGDSNTLVASLGVLAAQSGTAINPSDVTTANVGGKNVYVWNDPDSGKNYAYAAGDTLIFFGPVTDSQATKILSALP